MDIQRLLGANMGGMGGAPAGDQAIADTSEITYISSLALLKMLKHGWFVRLLACLFV